MNSVARSANGLLASLSADDFEAISPHLRTAEISQECSLIELGEAITHVYLPHSGVVSLGVGFANGVRAEGPMVGRDSIVAVQSALGLPIAVTNAVVLLPGTASLIDADRLR